MRQMTRDEWNRHVALIGVMIEADGVVNTLGAVLEALELIEKDSLLEYPEFYETEEGLSIQRYKDIIELAIQACDLHAGQDNKIARHSARVSFIKNVLPDVDKAQLYEKLRRMSPKEYTDLYRANILSDKTFDDLVREWPKC